MAVVGSFLVGVLVVVIVVMVMVMVMVMVVRRVAVAAEEGAGVDGVAVAVGDRRLLDHCRDGHLAPHVGEHGGQLVVFLQITKQLLWLDAVLPRRHHQPFGQVFLADLDVQFVGNGVEQQLPLDVLFCGGARFGFELVAR